MTASQVTLEDSQTLERLHQEVNNIAELEKRDLLALLKLINAPANLQSLFLILENLPRVLDKAKAIQHLDAEHASGIDFDKAISTCNFLICHKSKLEMCDVLGSLFPDENLSEWKQLVGKLGSNPLYCCLCFRPAHPDMTETYLQVQAQVLLASQLCQNLGDEQENGFLAVRKLSGAGFHKELQELPSQLISATDYLASISGAKIDSNTHEIAMFLAHAYHGRKRRKGDKEGKNAKRNRVERLRVAIEELDDYENPATLWTGDAFIAQGVLTTEEADEYARHGGTADEFSGGKDDVPIPLADEYVISPATLAELSFQSTQRSNQEALKNQLNPVAWSELNQFDIYVLCGYLSGEGKSTAPHDPLVSDCLSLMFWLSASLERVLPLPKFRGSPGRKSPEGLYLKDDRVLIARLYSPGAPLENKDYSRFSGQVYKVDDHCNIPLPAIAHTKSLLKSCRALDPGKKAQASVKAEPDEDYIESVAKRIRGVLANLNSEFGTRLSMGRISHFWLHTLAREQKLDLPSSMLFFGRTPRFSVARLHYTCAPIHGLENAYRKICAETLKEIGYNDGFPDGAANNDNLYLGTPFCPLRDTVRNLAKKLREAVAQSRPNHVELKYVVNFHNNFAMFTACMIAFSTTYRAVRDPSLYESDIHYSSGLGLVRDKDDDTFYHSRFVWISDECRKQIVNYRRHLQRLYEWFSLQNQRISSLFNNLDTDGRPLNLFVFEPVKSSRSGQRPINPEKRPKGQRYILEDLRPTNLEMRLQKYHEYFLPPNSHRHYLKRELLESGCPVEVIEAQLGHWELGMEPWNRFSNLHPQEFCMQLEKHLAPLLKQDGWEAIAGCDQ